MTTLIKFSVDKLKAKVKVLRPSSDLSKPFSDIPYPILSSTFA